MIVKFKKIPGRFITIDRGPIDDDDSLSFRAKGILTYLMGRPADWKPNQKEIATHTKDSLKSIRSGVKELQDAGYVVLTRSFSEETGKISGWVWNVSDDPENLPKQEKKPKALKGHTDTKKKEKEYHIATVCPKTVLRLKGIDNKKDQTKKELLLLSDLNNEKPQQQLSSISSFKAKKRAWTDAEKEAHRLKLEKQRQQLEEKTA
jgi:hypothetical protein